MPFFVSSLGLAVRGLRLRLVTASAVALLLLALALALAPAPPPAPPPVPLDDDDDDEAAAAAAAVAAAVVVVLLCRRAATKAVEAGADAAAAPCEFRVERRGADDDGVDPAASAIATPAGTRFVIPPPPPPLLVWVTCRTWGARCRAVLAWLVLCVVCRAVINFDKLWHKLKLNM